MTGTVPTRTSLSTDLARSVAALIADQELTPGDSLESVKLLAERFAVAVPTMREALRQLEGLGMVELRHGSGLYVGRNSGRSVLANPVLSSRPQMIELLEARRQLEPPIAHLAAETRQPEGIAMLTDALEEARAQIGAGDAQVWRTNLEIHTAVAAATGNAVLLDVMQSLVLLHAEDQREILRLHGGPAEDFDEHERLVQAITAGEPKAAWTIAEEHLAHTAAIIQGHTPPASPGGADQ